MTHIELFESLLADGTKLKAAYGEAEQARVAFSLIFVNDELPRFVHWGRPLSHPQSVLSSYRALRPQRVSGALDDTAWPSILPTQAESWTGASRFVVRRDGVELFCKFTVLNAVVRENNRHGTVVPSLVVQAQDREQDVSLTWVCELDSHGLIRQQATIGNTGEGVLDIERVELGYPVPEQASEILTTTGHHLRERSAQRQPLTIGRFEKVSMVGRPDFDASLLLTAGAPGFGFERGEAYATHVGWSGNSNLSVERTPYTQGIIGGGEVLFGGEISLISEPNHENPLMADRMYRPADMTSYTTPWVYGSYGDGLNEIAARFHGYLRECHPQFAKKSRPVILNTWEAVYFQHDYDTLTNLADKAAELGVERFVVDDGWFGSRRDDTSGLGDWQISQDVWPDGPHSLAALARYVHGKGMEFGLWFEPEMVNPDSEVARAHPDWLLAPTPHRLPMQGRSQQVIDLTNSEAYDYIYHSMDALVEALGIDYIKWDHNKLVTEAASQRSGRPVVHRQTLAVYRIFHDLKAAHSGLEIESCSSGGGRVDLGILEYADRIWASDCVDPVERVDIQRYTSLLVPPEMIGEHVGASPAHSTQRSTSQQLRMATAFFGHMGIEWNLLKEPQTALDTLKQWVTAFKERRHDFQTGTLVHGDSSDKAIRLDGSVNADRSRGTYCFTQLTSSQTYPVAPVRLPGLEAQSLYRVKPLPISLDLNAEQIGSGQTPLLWWNEEGVVLDGQALMSYGIRPPSLNVAQAVLFEAIRI